MNEMEATPRLWQERAPNGAWYVHTERHGDIFFGSDKDSAVQCFGALSVVHAQGSWECGARKQGTAGGNAPADCNWPGCGCDPVANKVLDTVTESGFEIVPISLIGRISDYFHVNAKPVNDLALGYMREIDDIITRRGPSISSTHQSAPVLTPLHNSGEGDLQVTADCAGADTRCPICDWPLAESAEKGCVPGDCSYRPDDPTEQARIKRRRAELSSTQRDGAAE